MAEQRTRPFKVWSQDRSIKKGVTVSSLKELISKGCAILKVSNPKIVLEEDGTEIDDEDYFSFLPDNTVLMFLTNDTKWQPRFSAPHNYDLLDGAGDYEYECDTADDSLSSITGKMDNELSNIFILDDSEIQILVDADADRLVHYLGKPKDVIKSFQEFCQRHLDEKKDLEELKDFIKLYADAKQSNSVAVKHTDSEQDEDAVIGKRKRIN
ncbi:hypothetical protein Btru_071871 [Bulinus truncatus]|nr:hypothetical protein Btru_071871 [Bulinus truncatus]